MDFRGRWVLVTGASSGLGRDIARVLSLRYGANLVLVARRQGRLTELQNEITGKTNQRVATITADLSQLAEVDRAIQAATEGRELYAAVLNAGVTHFGAHHELTWSEFERMLATNVTSVVRMTSQLLPHLQASGHGGGVMLVSSLSGLTPTAYQTVYSATKGFLVNYGCALAHELEGESLSITTVVPGGIATEMTETARFRALSGWLMPSELCAHRAVEAFRRREYLYVPGATMRVAALAAQLLPRKWVGTVVARVYRRALEAERRSQATPIEE